MGKISYRPKRNQGKNEIKRQQAMKNNMADIEMQETEAIDEIVTENIVPKISVVSNKKKQQKIDSTRIIGDLECEYHIYIEDYVYTYLYQLASADLTKESSAILVGEIYSDTKEAVVRAAIPLDMDKLEEDAEWIDMGVVEEAESCRKNYFPDQNIIGWVHMQPGYGTMLTMKELREHQNVFEGNGTICMLVDAINKIETVFVYEDEELKEQSGYCMYYERNEEMQQFMLDHPFIAGAKEEMKDTVVNQFREIGKMRKAEYTQKKNLNITVMAASVILIALTAVIVKMNDSKGNLFNAQKELAVGSNGIIDEDMLTNSDSTLLTQDELQQISSNVEGIENQVDVPVSEPVMSEKQTEVANSQKKKQQTSDKNAKAPVEKEEKQEEVEYSTYTVEVGDTLADICYKEYGSAERSSEVARFNGLSNTDQLSVGQELKMPK